MKLPYRIDLKGKTAAITGGNGVLGSAMAEALAGCGASVAILGRNMEKSRAVASRIEAAGGKCLPVQCDIMKVEELHKARVTIRNAFGQIDILINAAGGNAPKGTTSMERLDCEMLRSPQSNQCTFFDLPADGIRQVMDMNFTGIVLTCQALALDMAARGTGVIINVSSMSAMRPLTKVVVYGAAKAALSNFTQWLAVHLAGCGVRVNAIAPGFFLTEQNRSLLQNADGTPTPRAKTILAHTPMGRFGHPNDLIGALLWLVSDEASSFVTGALIPVDGGFSAFSGV